MKRIQSIIELGGEIRNKRQDYTISFGDYGVLSAQCKVIENLETLIKLDLYKLTNEVLQNRLKDDLGVDEKTIKTLKNKKELIDKIVEVM